MQVFQSLFEVAGSCVAVKHFTIKAAFAEFNIRVAGVFLSVAVRARTAIAAASKAGEFWRG